MGDRPEFQEVWSRLSQARGRAKELRSVFDCSLIPMVLVDHRRAYVDANAASRLFVRRTLEELRQIRIDDVIPPQHHGQLQELWQQLLRDGRVAGEFLVRLPDGPQMRVDFSAAANMLPGAHLIVSMPAMWPDRELSGVVYREAGPVAGRLSPRERDVLAQVAKGAGVRQIAEDLALSEHTVKTHLRNAVRRLGARNRAQAVADALRSGEILG